MVYKVLDIANKLLYKAANVDGGDLMSNMRLQKMLYYEQGYHLAVFGTPLFNEDIEAWMYGPVVPCVYEYFKSYGSGGILPPAEENIIELPGDEESMFNDVFDAYVDFSTYGLMIKTHNEEPWKSTYIPGQNRVIPAEKLKKFFESQVE